MECGLNDYRMSDLPASQGWGLSRISSDIPSIGCEVDNLDDARKAFKDYKPGEIRVRCTFYEPETGNWPWLDCLTVEEAEKFYEECYRTR